MKLNFNISITGLILAIFVFWGEPDNWDRINAILDYYYTQTLTVGDKP